MLNSATRPFAPGVLFKRPLYPRVVNGSSREGRAPLSYIPDGFSRAQARIAFMALFLRASVSSVAAFFFAFFLSGFFFARFANATPFL